MSHEEYVQLQRVRVVNICRAILTGDISIIEGVRELHPLLCDVDIDDFDPDRVSIMNIDSQTDHLPLGRERKHWAPKALAEEDAEIKERELVFKEEAFETCRNLISRFEKSNVEPPDSEVD